MNKTLKIFGFIFWAIGTGLYIAAMLTNYWVTVGIANNYGLFKRCLPNGRCLEFGWKVDTQSEGFVNILLPRILMLIGAGLIALGNLIGLVGFCTKQACPFIAEGTFEILGGLVVFAACAVFTAFNYTTPIAFLGINLTVQTFHYSFYFGWVSGAMFIVAGICSIVSSKKSSSY